MKFVVIFLITTILFLQVLKVYVQNELIDVGISREALLKQVDEYRRDNDRLRELILMYSSLQYIDQKARSEGFVDAKSEQYIYLQGR